MKVKSTTVFSPVELKLTFETPEEHKLFKEFMSDVSIGNLTTPQDVDDMCKAILKSM